MADTVRQVDYFYVQVPHRAGEAAKALRALKDAGVNLLAFSGFPEGRRAQLDFIPADAAAFKGVAKANKWKVVGPKHKGHRVADHNRPQLECGARAVLTAV
jgi:hypothetical protein